jgi:hypothetical protein
MAVSLGSKSHTLRELVNLAFGHIGLTCQNHVESDVCYLWPGEGKLPISAG